MFWFDWIFFFFRYWMEPQIRKRCYKNYILDFTCSINKAGCWQARRQTALELAGRSLPEDSLRSFVRATTHQALTQTNTSEMILNDLTGTQNQAHPCIWVFWHGHQTTILLLANIKQWVDRERSCVTGKKRISATQMPTRVKLSYNSLRLSARKADEVAISVTFCIQVCSIGIGEEARVLCYFKN